MARRAPGFALVTAIADPGFTPSRRDVPDLLELLVTGRSEVREHDKRLDAVELVTRNLITDLKHYVDKERADTCIGKKLIEEHVKEDEEVKATTIAAKTTLGAAIVPALINAVVTVAAIFIMKALS